jgi:hypothetical protein
MRKITFLAAMLLTSQAQAQGCLSTRPEAFSSFFRQFSASKPFAITRTIYPLVVKRHEYGLENGKDQHTVIATKVSLKEDSAQPSLATVMKANGLVYKISSQAGTEVIVDVFLPASDWLLHYRFINKSGCWQLREIEDMSVS